MRQLTVRRRKVFNAFAAKARVYIEDPYHPEITIEGTPCRKLGDMKNGGELSASIGDEAVRLFIIADKLSKSYSGDYYQHKCQNEQERKCAAADNKPGRGVQSGKEVFIDTEICNRFIIVFIVGISIR